MDDHLICHVSFANFFTTTVTVLKLNVFAIFLSYSVPVAHDQVRFAVVLSILFVHMTYLLFLEDKSQCITPLIIPSLELNQRIKVHHVVPFAVYVPGT